MSFMSVLYVSCRVHEGITACGSASRLGGSLARRGIHYSTFINFCRAHLGFAATVMGRGRLGYLSALYKDRPRGEIAGSGRG